jgi:predicted nucleic acid-binding protein
VPFSVKAKNVSLQVIPLGLLHNPPSPTVAIYFCDSSAVVKCYVQERGSGWMVALLDADAVHHLYLARITGVEVIAAVCRRTRHGDIAATDVAVSLAQFRRDFAGLYRVIEITPRS